MLSMYLQRTTMANNGATKFQEQREAKGTDCEGGLSACLT